MKRFNLKLKSGEVFVRYSENTEEARELKNLSQEVRAICNMCKKTGLWIVTDFEFYDHKVLVTSLEYKVEVTEYDVTVIKQELENRITLQEN